MYKRIAVTGASGHVGSTICRRLLDSGYMVVGIHRTTGRASQSLHDILQHRNFEHVLCDICDARSLAQAFACADAVIHCAAVISINGDKHGEVMRVNVDGVKCMYRCAIDQQVKRIIHISSIHAINYDEHDAIVDEHTPLAIDHHIAYNRSKALAQHWLEQRHDSRVIVVNLTGVIGPYDYHDSHTGSMLRNIAQKKLPLVLNAGFDWVDVRDISDAIITILKRGKHNRYLLSGRYATIKELSQYVGEALDIKTVQRAAPIWLAYVVAPMCALVFKIANRANQFTTEAIYHIAHSNRNMSHARSTTEFCYRPRPLKQTISDSMRWYCDNNLI